LCRKALGSSASGLRLKLDSRYWKLS
jgi:hypothetical protein